MAFEPFLKPTFFLSKLLMACMITFTIVTIGFKWHLPRRYIEVGKNYQTAILLLKESFVFCSLNSRQRNSIGGKFMHDVK